MPASRGFRLQIYLGAIVLAALLSGCTSVKSYVDPSLPVLTKSQIQVPTQPRPVQVLFEFRSKGNAGAAQTSQLRPRVVAVVAECGVFATVSSEVTASGGVLKLIIDNVPGTGNAVAKGVGTGLTFGLAGSMLTDLYVATASYSVDGRRTSVDLQHALHTTIGNRSGPAGLPPVSMMEGVNQIVDQLTWNALKQLSDKGAFNP